MILTRIPAFISNKNHRCFHIIFLLLQVYKHIIYALPHFGIKVVRRRTVRSFLFNVLIKSTYITVLQIWVSFCILITVFHYSSLYIFYFMPLETLF